MGRCTPCGPFFPPSWALPCTFLHSAEMQLSCFQSIVHSFARFCRHAELNSFLFNQFRTLLQKHPGGGHVLKENRLAVVAFTRRGGLLRRNSSTTDSRNGQLFSVERFFPDASSTASISARPRRRFLLRNKRKTSQKPGGSFSCAFAAPASASGTASISARPRRRFLLRNKRKTSQKPGFSFTGAVAAPTYAFGPPSVFTLDH